jgi:acetate---CoA ligase (ADP-forming)
MLQAQPLYGVLDRADGIARLLAPRSIALIGGDCADAVANAGRSIGYGGKIWRVNPKRRSTPVVEYYKSVDDLPYAPDAAFIAAPNIEVPDIAGALARRGAGGFVCFTDGFSEVPTAEGRRLTTELLAAAGDLPFFGPNCYGLINFFDRTALWPDLVVGVRRERGVALICQSGTIAMNLLFNGRSLPIGYVVTVGNQTCLSVEDMIELLAQDERVTAFGLYVEGIKDAARFAQAVDQARLAGKSIALVKAGKTTAAARAARTHTGANSGTDVVFDAFCRQAGVARCDSLATLCETLKVLHTGGPLPGRRMLVMGSSGGDMAMTADAAHDLQLEFPLLPAPSVEALREVLSDKVTPSNPFDFHSLIWSNRPALRLLFSVAQRSGYDAVGFMVDSPPAKADAKTYAAVIEQFIEAFPGARTRGAIISSLPESLNCAIRERCLTTGVVPLQGQRQALEAFELSANIGEAWARGARVELRVPSRAWPAGPGALLAEHEAKAALAAFGVQIPRSQLVSAADDAIAAAAEIGFPVVIKVGGVELEHKSDLGGVVVNIRTHDEARIAASRLATVGECLLIEEMVVDGVAEIAVGIQVDPQFGQVMILGAGGVLTELLQDTVTLLPPFTPANIQDGIERLAIHKLLMGHRGRPKADLPALIETAVACAKYAEANVNNLLELNLNPVIVRPTCRGAVAVDALIRLSLEESCYEFG